MSLLVSLFLSILISGVALAQSAAPSPTTTLDPIAGLLTGGPVAGVLLIAALKGITIRVQLSERVEGALEDIADDVRALTRAEVGTPTVPPPRRSARRTASPDNGASASPGMPS